MHAHKTGLALGGTVGFVHLVWSVLVLLGLAQPWVNFVYRLHMVRTNLTVGQFDLLTAIGLVVVTALVGYVVGYLFAVISSKVQKM